MNQKEDLLTLSREVRRQVSQDLEPTLPKGIKNYEQLMAEVDQLGSEIAKLREEILNASEEIDGARKQKP